MAPGGAGMSAVDAVGGFGADNWGPAVVGSDLTPALDPAGAVMVMVTAGVVSVR